METIIPATLSTSSQDAAMTDRLPSPEKNVGRKLKAHRKSRRGCGNCKLRRVKVGRRYLMCILSSRVSAFVLTAAPVVR